MSYDRSSQAQKLASTPKEAIDAAQEKLSKAMMRLDDGQAAGPMGKLLDLIAG